ncbi:hypothetical protein [Ekhidna sp.]|uniref:hypothetical protein n=1 Tax=Ekhidna sp. TaxID=2608089 RepID=UPI003C7E25D9
MNFSLYDLKRLAPTLLEIEKDKTKKRHVFACYVMVFVSGTIIWAIINEGYIINQLDSLMMSVCCEEVVSERSKKVDQVIYIILTNGVIFLITHWFMREESLRKIKLLKDFISDSKDIKPEEKDHLMNIFYEDLKNSIVLGDKYQNITVK